MASERAPASEELRSARDALFSDADRHGPRWHALLLRAAPAFALFSLVLLLACTVAWRDALIGRFSDTAADVLLVAPVLATLVLLVAALAPLARVRVEPLLGGALVLLALGTWLVARGWVVAASLPAAVGASLLGVAAARGVRRAVWTLPLLIAAGASDIQSVEGGITERLLSDTAVGPAAARSEPQMTVAPELLARIDYLVLHVPAATGTWLLGLVDVVAIGLLLGLTHLLWLPMRRTTLALGIALGVTVSLGTPLPVLPVLGLTWALVHARLVWRATRFSLRRLTYLGG